MGNAKDGGHGLFSSSLDTQQLIRDSQEPPLGRYVRCEPKERAWRAKVRTPQTGYQPAHTYETAFRHRGWLPDRSRVIAALKSANVPSGRLERFFDCGANCGVEVRDDGSRFRLSARYCGDRFCVPCCNARARVVLENLQKWTKGQSPLFITLTLRPMAGGCSKMLSHLLASFQRLRDQHVFRDAIGAGCYVVEITRGKRGDHWHVHLHALCLGGFIDQRELSQAWKIASRGSKIVHITRVNGESDSINYVAEYATKGWSRDCLQRKEWIVELVSALRRRRLLGTFGRWRGRQLESELVANERWIQIGPLVRIIDAARRNERWANGVLAGLNVEGRLRHDEVIFTSLERFKHREKS